MNKAKYYPQRLMMYSLIIFSIFSFVMYSTISYDLMVMISQIEGDMFCSNWSTIYNFIDSDYDNIGFGIGLAWIGFLMFSIVGFSMAGDIYQEIREGEVDNE